MKNDSYEAIADRNRRRAWQVVDELNLVKIWEAAGARVNSVGSLATGLLAKHLDIDFHIYSEPPLLPSGFAAMARIAENASVRRIECVNLLHTDEKCVEWHAWYEDRDGELWQIDMIHIEAGSAYDGYFERFARRLQRALTPEMRQAVLRLKFETPDHEKISGVEIYRAVVQGGVRTRAELERWRAEHPLTGISEWMPRGRNERMKNRSAEPSPPPGVAGAESRLKT